ncbi:hypothetical protein BDP27DRAFT_1370331 [Rhodocollybia butyracea]|uniref:Uncharacterized protein n=1 Tax=Rhodocollybia butyracea TaxID=206335 RepID=A0A9P5PB90_9AGAR|nr:hypothetical protein BDP27DRAFT_1370331 [Rhodocollybia butyracea]
MFLISAIFIGTLLEVLLYGAYVATFIRHVQILVLRRRKLPPRTFIYLSVASFLLLVIATVSVVSDFIFTAYTFESPINPIEFSGYDRKRNISNLYRSYILYSSCLCVIALPLVVFVVECVMASSDSFEEHKDLLEELKGLIIASGVPNLQPPSAYVQVGAIIINSAAINLVWLLTAFVTSTISSFVYEVFAGSFACVTYITAEDIDPLEYKWRQHSSECAANRKHGKELFSVGKTLKFKGAAIIQWNTSDVK